jgi:hypothetical protein
MSQHPPSILRAAEPRSAKRTCFLSLWRSIQAIIRPECLDYKCVGPLGLDLSDHSPHQTLKPTANLQDPGFKPVPLDLDAKDECSTRSILEVPPRPSVTIRTGEFWDEHQKLTQEKDGKHQLPHIETTTTCALGRTKCNQVISLRALNAEANEYSQESS